MDLPIDVLFVENLDLNDSIDETRKGTKKNEKKRKKIIKKPI